MHCLSSIQVLSYRKAEYQSYIVFQEKKTSNTNAILIDPLPIDNNHYHVILEHHINIATILVTKPIAYMKEAIRFLHNTYGADIITYNKKIFNIPSQSVQKRTILNLCGFSVECIPIILPNIHMLIYCIEDLCFTGSIIQAGTIEYAHTAKAEEALLSQTQNTFSQQNYVLLPSIGPPTTVKAEQDTGLLPIIHSAQENE